MMNLGNHSNGHVQEVLIDRNCAKGIHSFFEAPYQNDPRVQRVLDDIENNFEIEQQRKRDLERYQQTKRELQQQMADNYYEDKNKAETIPEGPSAREIFQQEAKRQQNNEVSSPRFGEQTIKVQPDINIERVQSYGQKGETYNKDVSLGRSQNQTYLRLQQKQSTDKPIQIEEAPVLSESAEKQKRFQQEQDKINDLKRQTVARDFNFQTMQHEELPISDQKDKLANQMRMMMKSGNQNPFEVANNVINKLQGIDTRRTVQKSPIKQVTCKDLKEIEKVAKEDIFEDKPQVQGHGKAWEISLRGVKSKSPRPQTAVERPSSAWKMKNTFKPNYADQPCMRAKSPMKQHEYARKQAAQDQWGYVNQNQHKAPTFSQNDKNFRLPKENKSIQKPVKNHLQIYDTADFEMDRLHQTRKDWEKSQKHKQKVNAKKGQAKPWQKFADETASAKYKAFQEVDNNTDAAGKSQEPAIPNDQVLDNLTGMQSFKSKVQTGGGAKIGTLQFTMVKKLETQIARLLSSGQNKVAKDLVEEALKKNNYQEPSVYMLCAQANLKLGYVTIAEQMYQRCLQFDEYSGLASQQLGQIYRQRGENEKALEYLLIALDMQKSPTTAFEIGKLYAIESKLPDAIEYINFAIEMAISDSDTSVEKSELAKMYFSRMRLYEQLDMNYQSKQDHQRIVEIDPYFFHKKRQPQKDELFDRENLTEDKSFDHKAVLTANPVAFHRKKTKEYNDF